MRLRKHARAASPPERNACAATLGEAMGYGVQRLQLVSATLRPRVVGHALASAGGASQAAKCAGEASFAKSLKVPDKLRN
mmetsp:Transcript_102111/g.284306  ORF Transcript_102111/g.284306 Transcript_102111/m.284306 type:complete len:80 (+) Transcript_102111:6-245(+)